MLFLLLLNTTYLFSFAQKENNTWIFGQYARLNFNGTSVTPHVNTRMNVLTGSATASTPSGNLLFYTDGTSIWNKNDSLMPNGTGLLGNANGFVDQGVVIVPFTGNPNKYYIFGLNSALSGGGFSGSLHYSVVDMTLDGGLGDVSAGQKNVSLWNNSDTVLNSVMNVVYGDDCNVWLIVHTAGKPLFLAFEINETGVKTTPVVSFSGLSEGSWAYALGRMEISPDRHKIANVSSLIDIWGDLGPDPGFSSIELHDFNPATGSVGPSTLLDSTSVFENRIYGTCFSADGSKLYMSVPYDDYEAPIPEFAGIYQFNLSMGSPAAIKNSKVRIVSKAGFGSMRLGPDNKIYITNGIGEPLRNISGISNPNLAGPACSFTDTVLMLLPGTGANYDLSAPMLTKLIDTSIDKGNQLLTSNDTDADDYQWINCNTGVPVAGASSASFAPAANGSYAVIVTQYGCRDTSSCYTISNIVGISKIQEGPGITLFPNPTASVLFIINEKQVPLKMICVTDVLGIERLRRNLNSDKMQEADLRMLPDGIYFITIQTPEITFTQKIEVRK